MRPSFRRRKCRQSAAARQRLPRHGHRHPDGHRGGVAADDVRETVRYIDWFNQRRLHSEINGDTYVMPAEFERS